MHKDDQRMLVDHFNFVLNKGDKAVIIGEEGNGKSTLLKAIHNRDLVSDYAEISGSINKLGHKSGYLPQEIEDKEKSALEFFMDIDDFFEISPKKIKEIAASLKIDSELFYSDRPLKSFSGGEVIKLGLAHLLMEDDDILLLDEPSNNLDLKTLEFLEDFIKNSDQAILFISHDEALINNCANIIIHLELLRKRSLPHFTIYKGKYEDYLKTRQRAFLIQDKNAAKERSELRKKEERYRRIYQRVDYELNTITRQDAHGGQLLKKKMHATKALGRRLEKEKANLSAFHDEEAAIMVDFEDVYIASNKRILDLSLDELRIADRVLSCGIKLEIYGPKKIAIIGDNGIGKSTLLRYINDVIDPGLKVAYMPQNYEELMDMDKIVIDFIKEERTKAELTYIATLLGSIKFKEEEMFHKIKDLSGGQKAKLFFIKMIAQKSEVLLLDEPSRNFSPLSNPVIREILKNFKGAIIMVSHDRLLLKAVADKIYELKSDGLKEVEL